MHLGQDRLEVVVVEVGSGGGAGLGAVFVPHTELLLSHSHACSAFLGPATTPTKSLPPLHSIKSY